MPRPASSSTSPGARPAAGTVGPQTPHLFVPTAQRPVRAKRAAYAADTHVVPHAHPWAQLAYSATGVIRVTAARGTFLVPPSRAVWIPPGVEHAVTVVEACEMRTLYLHQGPSACGPAALSDEPPGPGADAGDWSSCRVLEVTDLLRALVMAMPVDDDRARLPPRLQARERRLAALIADELCAARPVPLGVALPQDKRLRAVCEAILDDPARHATLEAWARDRGASARTLARLFRTELETSFGQWRQQALLARALTLAGRGRSMGSIAAELGYASPSAFSAMVRRTVGVPPSRFFAAA